MAFPARRFSDTFSFSILAQRRTVKAFTPSGSL